MAQKTNPNILRIGQNKNWKYKYIEKNKEELPTYIFKTLENKNYIKSFLRKNGLLLQDLKINFYKSNIKIYIPYYTASKSNFLTNQKIILKKKFKNTHTK